MIGFSRIILLVRIGVLASVSIAFMPFFEKSIVLLPL